MSGWPIVGAATAVVGAIVGIGLADHGLGEDGMRYALRATARTSIVLFLAAFAASALSRTWPSAGTRWLLANRRYVGVSFAVSHLIHLLAIVELARLAPEKFWHEVPTPTVVAGGLGFVVIAAMAATSFDRTAAWLGPRRWRLLHTFGAYYVWLIFFLTYAPGVTKLPANALGTVALVAVMALRLSALPRRRIAVP